MDKTVSTELAGQVYDIQEKYEDIKKLEKVK